MFFHEFYKVFQNSFFYNTIERQHLPYIHLSIFLERFCVFIDNYEHVLLQDEKILDSRLHIVKPFMTEAIII